MGIWRRLLGAGAIAALALVSLQTATPPAQADVDDFSYDSWSVEYSLDVDADGRAIARVTETLTARFPDHDQNRGLVRGLPDAYEDAPIDPRDFSVTDAAGDPVPFEIERDGGFVAVLTGDDDYVHGVQTYVITYTLSDVVLARDDGTADEFYWNLTDFEHRQPIDAFSASIVLSPALAEQLDGNARCYRGPRGSTQQCEIVGDGSGFTISVDGVGPREGVTAAIGLRPGAVMQPPQRLPDPALDVLPVAGGAAVLGLGVAGTVAVAALRRRHRTARGTIVPQYDVPAHLPPLLAAQIVGSAKNPAAAQIVHLAVSGAIRIEEGEATRGLFGTKPPPVHLRVVDDSRAVDPLDKGMLRTIFPHPTPGEVFAVPASSESFSSKMSAQQSTGLAAAKQRGYFENRASRGGRIMGCIGLVLAIATMLLSLVGIANRPGPGPVIGLVLGAVGAVLAVIAVCPHRVHTALGAESREYLEGVRLFIRVAEADRIEMLQSYSGAERSAIANGTGGDGDASTAVIHLYERLLPYAMLFGLEKQWAEALSTRYEAQPGYAPYWYPSATAHGIAGFESTISRFTGSMSSAASYTSSSSGGSSGGGFSGGGGGGGFSGGR